VLSFSSLSRYLKWAGSLSLALQGIDVEPHDIDLLTDRQGAYRINAMLKKYEKKRVGYSETEKLSSYFGVFEIQGVKVEVMGDYRERQGTKWVSLSRILADPKIIEVDGVRIPVCSLEDHLVSYRRLKRPKDAEKIRKISQRQDTMSSQRRMERTKDTE
jgi:predicted nucleotidyltransferase